MTTFLTPARRGLRRLTVGVAALGLAALPLTADAHVRIHADSTAAGTFTALTFRVPTESDTASTTAVSVELPQDTPFLYISTKPVPGWTAKLTEETLPQPVEAEGTTVTKAVRTVTWTAGEGAAIKPGEYQEFAISAGPLPQPGTVLLPATQTYSDGSVVRWDEPSPAGGDEPQHPAPALVVTAAEGAATPGAPAPTEGEPAQGQQAEAAATDTTARGLGIAGLLAGAAGLVVAGLAGRRRPGSGPAA